MKALKKTTVLLIAALLVCTMAVTAFAQVPSASTPDTSAINPVNNDTASTGEVSGITSTAPISAPDTGMGSALPGLLLVIGAGAVGLALMKEKD